MRTIVSLLAASVLVACGARADREVTTLLHPTTYTSPSGEYTLFVNPSTMGGRGPGEHRLSRNNDEIWSATLPFTFWEAVVTDDGTVAGYAYSLGFDNHPVAGEVGSLHSVIIAPDGELRLDESLPREGVTSCTSSISRSVSSLIVDPAHDRMVVFMHGRGNEQLREFALSTGDLSATRMLVEAELPPDVRVHDMTSVPGTDLLLLVGSARNDIYYALLDINGAIHWNLRLIGGLGDDGEGRWRRFTRLGALFTNGGFASRASGRFDIWAPKDGERVTFAIEKGDPTESRVREVARTLIKANASTSADEPQLETAPTSRLGSVVLRVENDTLPEVRDIAAFAIDGASQLGLLRRELGETFTFLRVAPEGAISQCVPLPEIRAAHPPRLDWIGGDNWIITVIRHTSHQPADIVIETWRIDAATGVCAPFALAGEGDPLAYTATADGGFVALRLLGPEKLGGVLVAYDADGAETWRSARFWWTSRSLPGLGLFQLPDGRIALADRSLERANIFDPRSAGDDGVDWIPTPDDGFAVGALGVTPDGAWCAVDDFPEPRLVWPVVTGVVSAETTPSAARFAFAYVTKFVTHA